MPKKFTLEDFIEKSTKIHNNKYDYSESVYISNKHKIEIACPIHGKFLQTAMHHLSGSGCKKCNCTTGWSKTNWVNTCNSKSTYPVVYIIKCWNKNEEFIKIGRTCQLIHRRFHNKIMMPYNYEVIKEIKGSPEYLWDKEVELHRFYKTDRYIPKISFDGIGECFNISILSTI